MIMKKQIISWGMMLAAAFTLTNCAKEIEGPAQESETNGYPFEIVASAVSTKTVNDGMATKWEENDKINLFHVEAGGTADYQNDKAFTVADVDAGRFTGELSSELEAGKKYDWYAIYPYSSQIETPGERTKGYTFIGHSNGLNQNGYNSTDALDGSNCPFYGVAKSVAANSIPSIDMKHLTSVVAINVTNTTDTPVTITTASLTATEDIVGSYYIDITGSSVIYNPSEGYVKNTATVNVSGGTALEKNQSAILYLAIKPFTAAEGTNLVLAVNGLEKTLELPNDVEFSAGKIKTLNFKYDAENVEVPAISVADFMELVDGPKVYELTGRITRIKDAYSTQFNNIAFYLKDSTGEVLIYRMSCVGIDNPANTITVGDEITVRGSKTTYSGAAQMAQGGVYVSHRDGCATPVISCSENMVTITSEDGAKVYYTTDDTDPTTSSTPYTAPFAITETNTVKAIAVAEGKLTSLVAEKECVWVDLDAEQPATVIATLKFTDTSTRTAHTTDKQVWEENGLMLVGEKAGSSSNVGDYSNPARFYKSSTITIKAPGNITKLVFESAADESSDSKKYLSFLETAVGDHTVDGNFVTVILDGTSNAVTYTMPGQVRLFNLEVTYIAGDGGEEPEQLQPRNLAFSPATATATVGQSFTEPTLSGVTTGVEYTSSNESVATVNAETGDVTLVGAGTTTITASAPATAEYEAGEASYTLTVSAPVVDDSDYSGQYAIVAYRNSESLYYYLTNEETGTSTVRLTAVSAGTNKPEDNVVVDASKLWNVSKSGSVYTIQSVASEEYVSWTSGNSAVMSETGLQFTVTKQDDGSFNFVSGDRYLSLNSTKGTNYFAMYAGTQTQNLYLIKAIEGEEAVPELTGITVNATKTTFTVGDEFAFEGTVTANYSNSTTKDVTTSAAFSGYNMSQQGTQTITVTYEGKTATYDITVNPAQGGGEEPEQPGEPVTITKSISSYGFSNEQKVTSIKLDDIITATASTGTNTGKYYTSDKTWRFYQNETGTLTISAEDNYLIQSVKLTFTTKDNGVLKYLNATISNNVVCTVEAQTASFAVGSTSGAKGKVFVKEIEVVYKKN